MKSNEPLTLIINPIAGRGFTQRSADAVIDVLRSGGWDLNVVHSTGGDHIEQLTAAGKPGQVFAVLSGDGGISYAAAGAVKSGAVVAPLPGGRGNDFVRKLGLPCDPVQVASRLLLAEEKQLDIAFVGDKAFLGVASVGFDSFANEVANNTNILRGPLVYAYGALSAFIRFKPNLFHISIDDTEFSVKAWNVAIGNSGRYGGGMLACPKASMEDGLLDLVIIGAVPRWRFPSLLAGIFKGTHVRIPLVNEYQAKEIKIRSDYPMPLTVFADGEPVCELPETLTVQREKLRVLA